MTVLASARQVLGQAWWAPLAAVLVVAELLVAQAFLIGDGTSNVSDRESTFVGAALALGGAGLLTAGLVIRQHLCWLGTALMIAGSALAAIWFWTGVMTPMALVVIIGVVLTQARELRSAKGRP